MSLSRIICAFLAPLALFAGIASAQDAPPATAGTNAEADYSFGAIAKRVEHYRPAIEKELGSTFEKPIRFRLATSNEIRKVIATENARFRSEIEGGPRGGELAAACEKEAASLAPMLIAKIELETGDVLLQTESFARMAAIAPEFAGMTTQDFLDVILIHETVHVHQHRTWDIDAFIGRPATMERISAATAVIEGHAQHIARRVAAKKGLSKAFDLLVLANSEVPSSVKDPGLRMVLGILTSQIGFAYVQGEAWYAAVADALGSAEAEKRAFTAPPTRMRQISRPAEYLKPPAEEGLDLGPIAKKVVPLYESEETVVQLVPMSEAVIRGAVALAAAEEIEKGLAGFRAGLLVHTTVKGAPPGTLRLAALISFESPEAAKAFLVLERQVSEAKDKLFSRPDGLYKLERSDYEEPGIEGMSGFYAVKKVTSAALPAPILGKTLVIRKGAVVVEIAVTNLPDTKETLVETAKKVLALLPD